MLIGVKCQCSYCKIDIVQGALAPAIRGHHSCISWGCYVSTAQLNRKSGYFQLGPNSLFLYQIGDIGHAKESHHCSHQLLISFVTYHFQGHGQKNKVSKVGMWCWYRKWNDFDCGHTGRMFKTASYYDVFRKSASFQCVLRGRRKLGSPYFLKLNKISLKLCN